MTRLILAVALAITLLGCESSPPTASGNRDFLHEREIYDILKQQPVPLPNDTPYDADARRREVYVEGFRAGYECAISGRVLHTFLPTASGLPEDMRTIWNAGCMAGAKVGSERWLVELQSFVKPVGQTGTNIADVVLTEGGLQRDLAEVKPQLPSALTSAVLVVRARVLNSDSAVEASPMQHEVSTGQGWRAALVQTTCVLKGEQQVGLLWVANGGFRADGLHWRYPIEATNGQLCILVLEKDEELSRWCQTNVFAIIRGLEVK